MGSDDRAVTRPGRAWTLAVLLLTLALSLASVRTRPQLGIVGGLTDEYFFLGARLRTNGTLGLSATEPSALRAPGYPAFVALVLALALPPPGTMEVQSYIRAGMLAVCVAQALLLAAAAAGLRAWLAARLDPWIATWIALVFGLGPTLLVLAGVMHYAMLHVACMVFAAWGLERALRPGAGDGRMLAAGVLWGVSTLVRPVTLLLPGFLLLALLLWPGWTWRRAVRAALLLALGSGAVLVPWTLRNVRVTGRLVAVTDNNWVTLWGQTARPLRHDPDHYVWFDLYMSDFMPVFTRATGQFAYDYDAHVRRIEEVERAFRGEAVRNLRERPVVYARNVAGALSSLLVQPTPLLLAAFREIGRTDPGPGVPPVPQAWFVEGQGQPSLPAAVAAAALCAFAGVMGLALLGVAASVRRPDALGVVLCAILACALLTHALVFTHLMHYYVRWPLAIALAAVGLDALGRRGPRWLLAARGAGAALALLSLAVSLALL